MNRRTTLKHPETGKTVCRINPETEWIRGQAPSMRIIEQTLWQVVRERIGELDSQAAFGRPIGGGVRRRQRTWLTLRIMCVIARRRVRQDIPGLPASAELARTNPPPLLLLA